MNFSDHRDIISVLLPAPLGMYNDSMQSRIITVPYLSQDFNVDVSAKERGEATNQRKGGVGADQFVNTNSSLFCVTCC